jgi:glycerol-3-phosphate acyltransferase PlsX
MVSAGNTGATMASALLRMGRIKGVNRPAIATQLPVPGTTPTTLLDAGANAECQPEWLVQFVDGLGVRSHRWHRSAVGLLSIGEESRRATPWSKRPTPRETPGVNFIGNVEGATSDRRSTSSSPIGFTATSCSRRGKEVWKCSSA